MEVLQIKRKKFQLILKRIFDIFANEIALIILLPIFTIIGIFIKLDSKAPVFFNQEGARKNGKIFRAYKLRTMLQGVDKITRTIILMKKIPTLLRWEDLSEELALMK